MGVIESGCLSGSDEMQANQASRHDQLVNGAWLPFASEGDGEPVILLHGALADHRMWDSHRPIIARRFRAVAYTQRYFGREAWGSDWPPFGIETHAADLAAFIRGLRAGPAHVVAWSYGGHVALTVAQRNPELIKSAFVYEPGIPSYVTDAAALDAFTADANAMFSPVFEAAQGAGDVELAVELLIDGSGQRKGYFQSQPRERQQLQMDNARTIPLLLAQSAPPQISCAELGALKAPACIAYGERTRPLFKVVSQAAAHCIGGDRHQVIPGVGHMWPDEDPEGFSAAVLRWLGKSQAARP